MGAASKILGIDIIRNRYERKMFLSQKSYIDKVLVKFKMQGAKPVSTPLAQHFKLPFSQSPKNDKETKYMERVPYANAVGSIMYCMVCTRPDLAFAVSIVSRFMSNPGREKWEAMKWILRYLNGSKDICHQLGAATENSRMVEGFVDLDYAGCLDTRKSTSGYMFTAYGGAVSWKASLQKVVALSTTEAEYMAATEAVKEGLWLQGFIEEVGINQEDMVIYCDNQSAIHLMKNPMFHERSKHIDIRLHFIRDIIASGAIKVKKIGTEDNPADMLTKVLQVTKFSHCLDFINVVKH